MHGEQWYTPTLGSVAIKHLTLGCRLRLWFSASASMLAIAFLEPPTVHWDIEMALLVVGIPLPDSVEDDWLAKSVKNVLVGITVGSPLELDLTKPPPDAGVALMGDLGQAYGEATAVKAGGGTESI